MTLNSTMVVILHYFTEFCSCGGQLHQSGWRQTYDVSNKNVAQRI